MGKKIALVLLKVLSTGSFSLFRFLLQRMRFSFYFIFQEGRMVEIAKERFYFFLFYTSVRMTLFNPGILHYGGYTGWIYKMMYL